MIRSGNSVFDMNYILAADWHIAALEGRAYDEEASRARLKDLSGFTLIACTEFNGTYGCLVIEIGVDGEEKIALGSVLYVEPGAPNGAALELLQEAGKKLTGRGVGRIKMTSAWDNRHKAFENMGFTPKTVIYEGCVSEILTQIENRLSRG